MYNPRKSSVAASALIVILSWMGLSRRSQAKAGALALIFILSWNVNAPAQDKLIFAVDIIRHGDRTPTAELPGAKPGLWPEGLGKLTARGKEQEYELGARMRERYLREGLLGTNDTASAFRVYSTDFDRTRASAQMFLKGLLAGKDLKIPIRTTIPGVANPKVLLIPTAWTNYGELLTEHVFNQPEWLATNNVLQSKFKAWSEALGLPLLNPHDLIPPSDTLYIHQAHNMPVTNKLTVEERQEIVDAGRWALVYQYQTEVGRITGRPLLAKIAEYLNTASAANGAGKTNYVKYILISTHDSTILSQMKTLGAPLTGARMPPYAACLHYGLFAGERGNYVIVNYNDGGEHVVPNPDGGAAWPLAALQARARP